MRAYAGAVGTRRGSRMENEYLIELWQTETYLLGRRMLMKFDDNRVDHRVECSVSV